MKGRYDFFDGFVGTHACDCAQRVGQMWRNLMKTKYDFFLDMPHTLRPTAVDFFIQQLAYFKTSLEEYTGIEMTAQRLQTAIEQHNRQRLLVGELYQLRKPDPPLITGSEVLQVMIALNCIPVAEGNDLLQQIIDQVQTREHKPPKKVGRLMVWGSLLDHVALTELAESSDLHIVIDDTALGTRSFTGQVDATVDPLAGMARHYLENIYCPRTYKKTSGPYQEALEQKFGYLNDFIKEWRVNGVYLNLIRNCDCHGYEIPLVKDYLEGLGLPVLAIEHDYSTASLEPLRTRFQAFAEALD